MKKIFTLICLSAAILFTYSCAGKMNKNLVFIDNTLPEAKVTVFDKKGVEVFQGRTPASIPLKANTGGHAKTKYQVKFEKEGYVAKTVPVEYKPSGWYFENILFGNIVGLLVIDPVTGAMYKLNNEFINDSFVISTASIEREELKVFGITEIPREWKNHLVMLDN